MPVGPPQWQCVYSLGKYQEPDSLSGHLGVRVTAVAYDIVYNGIRTMTVSSAHSAHRPWHEEVGEDDNVIVT